MQAYHIINGEEKTGPFDLVSLVRRIKNGKLKAHDLVLEEGGSTPIAANEVKVLHDYFLELEYPEEQAASPANASIGVGEAASLKELLADGWSAFEANQFSALVVAGGMIATLIIGIIVSSIASGMIAAIVCCALFGAQMQAHVLMSGLSEQQAPSWVNIRSVLFAPTMRKLLAAGALVAAICVGVPLMLWHSIGFASLLFTFLGYLIFSSLLFSPLIWLNNESLSAPACLKSSTQLFAKLPPPNLLKALGIQGINFVSAALLIFPLVLALPVTGFAWNRFYHMISAPNNH